MRRSIPHNPAAGVFPVCLLVPSLVIVYLYRMDERRKTILTIEERKAAEAAIEEERLRTLGRLLLERSDDGRLAVERNAYTRLNGEISALRQEIAVLTQKTGRAAELAEFISEAERQYAETEKELAAHYPELGRRLFEPANTATDATADAAASAVASTGADFDAFTAPYKRRISEIQQKAETLANRLAELETGEKNNVFSWLGKRAQGMVVKSSLSRTEAALRQVYAEAGCELLKQPSLSAGAALDGICADAVTLKEACDSCRLRTSTLKEEKRCITEELNREGAGAVRKKTSHEQQLLRDLDHLYLRLGKKARDPVARLALQSLFDDEMAATLETALKSRAVIDDYDEQVTKLRVSLEVDDERSVIEKWERAILEERRRIGDSEKKIAEYEKFISDAGDRIARLEQIKR